MRSKCEANAKQLRSKKQMRSKCEAKSKCEANARQMRSKNHMRSKCEANVKRVFASDSQEKRHLLQIRAFREVSTSRPGLEALASKP